jgi:phosphoserine aminotransferase
MRPLSFIPGPAKISTETYDDIVGAVESGVLEQSHRGMDFSNLSHGCIAKLKSFLGVPEDYKVFYLSSATSAWHSIVANTVKERSFHIVQGAFSAKAEKAAEYLYKQTTQCKTKLGEQCTTSDLQIPAGAEVINCCLNESSTGVRLAIDELGRLRKGYPEPLLAVDITSCAGAIEIPMELADIWYFSVQKAFGLPAGLGILMVSPRAYQKSVELEKSRDNLAGVWRWSNYVAAQQKHPGQTIQTPNMFNIYLLEKQLTRFSEKGLKAIAADTARKAQIISGALSDNERFRYFVKNPANRSETVITVEGEINDIATLHKAAKKRGIVLGMGYGEIKNTTLRIANFPAHTVADMTKIAELLRSFE